MKCLCFKCEVELESCVGSGAWEGPCGAVTFVEDGNYGSALYDKFIYGPSIQIAVCDECLKKAEGTDRLRDIRNGKPRYETQLQNNKNFQ